MHAKRFASRESPATRELYTLHRYGVCPGASKGCLILRHTSLSWLWRSFVFLLAIRHHFKKYSTQCLMCCFFFECFYLFSHGTQCKRNSTHVKKEMFLLSSQLTNLWARMVLMWSTKESRKKNMALKSLPASDVHWTESLPIKLLCWTWSKSDPVP